MFFGAARLVGHLRLFRYGVVGYRKRKTLELEVGSLREALSPRPRQAYEDDRDDADGSELILIWLQAFRYLARSRVDSLT